ncbi:Hypothetical predicted protein [Paramuricea clavata]|uniref:Uncharacterized protein n=1 Tax=Paramuricea clavata TaxID=317549 RepID=A0A6S7LBD6_PARCT|nr:Hypothetical predicted protein [Paramuricea clavata]
MAQLNIQEYNDLNKVLQKVPRFQAGMKSFSHMVKTYFEKFALKDAPEYLKQCIEFIYLNLPIQEQLSKYFDTEPPFQLDESVLSGSWSEGLVLYDPYTFDPPDVDFLCILKNIHFTDADQVCGDLSLSENSPFVNAYLSDINLLKLWQSYLLEPASHAMEGRICQLSSNKLKEHLYKNYSKGDRFFRVTSEQCNPITDSPALKLSRNSARGLFHGPFWKTLFKTVVEHIWRCSDLVLAIRCDGWPQNALEWIHRERNWPSRDVIESVTKAGFHIVAKSSHAGNFRLSFSRAEGILIENLNKVQHKVIRAFKAVIKFLIPCNPDSKETLTSYHLKTIGLWHLEKSASETWIEDNIATHLLQMLKELVRALRMKNLPMYFLREYNLFSGVENLSYLETLADKVEQISQDIPGLKKAVKMGANFHFYDNYMDYFKTCFSQSAK